MKGPRVRALVTGGAGFIGSHVVESLVAAGHEVAVLDDLSTGAESNLARVRSAIELCIADVRDEAALLHALRDRHAVVHLAAQVSVPRSVEDPASTMDVNATATARLLALAARAGCTRFVLASSCAVYGDALGASHEGQVPKPLSPYAVSKLAAEHLVASAAALAGMAGVSLRFFNVYGSRQNPGSAYAAVVPRFLAALRADEPPVIFGDGEQTRDFVSVEDVVSSIERALAAPRTAWGRAFNVGTGRKTSLNELEEALRTALAQRNAPTKAPVARHEAERPGDLRHSSADVSLASDVLGFSAALRLPEGLARMLAS